MCEEHSVTDILRREEFPKYIDREGEETICLSPPLLRGTAKLCLVGYRNLGIPA